MDTTEKPKTKKLRKPSLRQKRAAEIAAENGGNISRAMIDAGYSPATAKTPQKLTDTDGWQQIMGAALPDANILEKHRALLDSHRLDHMIFPLGPRGDDDPNFSGARPITEETSDPDADPEAALPEEHKERTDLSDKEIIALLAEVNCTVRRIVHGQSARHVYFWSPDNKARKEALDMAYKLKGKYAADRLPTVPTTINNFFYQPRIQQAVKLAESEIKNIIAHAPSIQAPEETVGA